MESITDDKRLEYLRLISTWKKTDLHSHAGRGGNKKFIEEFYGMKIENPPERFSSLQHMQEWYMANIRDITCDKVGVLKRWEAAFRQANEDNIAILAMSFGMDEGAMFGGLVPFTKIIKEMSKQYAPDTIFLPELSFR